MLCLVLCEKIFEGVEKCSIFVKVCITFSKRNIKGKILNYVGMFKEENKK